jgi:hypothetical protein
MTALLLGKEKDPETLSALREALSDKDWSVRAAAVHLLALRNDPAVERDLTRSSKTKTRPSASAPLPPRSASKTYTSVLPNPGVTANRHKAVVSVLTCRFSGLAGDHGSPRLNTPFAPTVPGPPCSLCLYAPDPVRSAAALVFP